MRRLFWAGCLTYLLNGFAHVVIGSLLPLLLHHYNGRYEDGGILFFLQFLGFLVGVIATPDCIKKLGARNTLIICSAALFIAQTVYAFLPPWPVMLIIAPLAGLGFGVNEAVVAAVIMETSPAETKAVAFSRLEVMFGVGALAMPLISWALAEAGWWRGSFVLLSLFSLAMLIVWSKLSFGPLNEHLTVHRQSAEMAEQQKRTGSPYRGKHIFLFLFLFFFVVYVGTEMSIVNFFPSLMIESFGMDESVATAGISLFWFAMVIGRFYCGAIAERMSYARYLLWSCSAATLLLIILCLAGQIWLAMVLIGLIGLTMSGMFSIGLIYANDILPGDTERTTSIMIAAAGLGGAALPYSAGWAMDHLPLLSIKAGFAVAIFVLFVIIAFIYRRNGGAGGLNKQRLNQDDLSA